VREDLQAAAAQQDGQLRRQTCAALRDDVVVLERRLGDQRTHVGFRQPVEHRADALVVRPSRDAPHVDQAYAFINYLQKPEVAAANTKYVSYANGNLASQKFIDKAVLEDRTIYPDEATMSRLYTMNAHDAKTTRLMNRLWTRIKTGR